MNVNDENWFWFPRSKWPEGPWDAEGTDREQWEHAGFACLAMRGPSGSWNGYVGLPHDHPWSALMSGDIPAEVHGGVTYCGGQPGPGVEPPSGLRWIGFDCAHAGDLTPCLLTALHACEAPVMDILVLDVYRDIAFVKAHVQSLAEQAAKAGGAL